MEITCRFKKIYEPLFSTNARYYDLLGGRGRGGSFAATDYALFLITQPAYCRIYFIRQTFGDIRDSLFRDFKDRIEENESVTDEDFSIQDNEMRIMYKPTGNMIISKGVKKEGSRTAKMKSLAGATHVFIEEADELGEEDFDQLDLSVRTTKTSMVKVIRIFNPPHRQHWIWRDYNLLEQEPPHGIDRKDFQYYKPIPKQEASLVSIFSWYPDNLKFLQDSTIEKFESFKLRKPEYYYTVIRGLISEGQRGRIFSGWQPVTDTQFNNIDARSIFGLDFGTSSPAGLVECKLVKNDIYLREQNYQGMTGKEIAMLMCKLQVNDRLVIADSAEPHSISKLRRGWERSELTELEIEKYPQLVKGFNIRPAIKGPGSIATGIDMLKDANVYCTESSVNLWKEYRDYKWALDANKNPTDEPEDNNNHLIDPARYVRQAKGRLF